ncbi:hypothetical protein [Haliea sp.]|uniref:hypothetical protein n=1 Tax=Haliea sp. TaxID=1932666 RepID=UPI00257DC33E|nr:hypothetical protein [Haliea sp.]|tara:strand:+ start:157 stop:1284 length:1128 start_codon:yes stop_codon:yes gene_type:complete
MSENSELMINPATRIPLTATGYVQPVAEDYAALKGYTSFTGLDFSSALGVSASNFRSYFRAKNINKDQGIPYYHWRFLIEACGLERPVTVEEPNNSGLKKSVFDKKNWECPDASAFLLIKGRLGVNDVNICQRLNLKVKEYHEFRVNHFSEFSGWLEKNIEQSKWFEFLERFSIYSASDLLDVKSRLNPKSLETYRSGNYEPPFPEEFRAVRAAFKLDVPTTALLTGLRDDQVEFFSSPQSFIKHVVKPRAASYGRNNWAPPRHDDIKAIIKVSSLSVSDVGEKLGLPRWELSKLKLKGYSKTLAGIEIDDWFDFLRMAEIDSVEQLQDKMKSLIEEEESRNRPSPFFESEFKPVPYSAWRLLIQGTRLVESEKI